jgi:hypothetical protein
VEDTFNLQVVDEAEALSNRVKAASAQYPCGFSATFA